MRKKQLKNIILDIELLPEGVYLTTSKDVPGLVVETQTVEEIRELVEDMAPYLLQRYEERKHKEEITPNPLGRMIYPMTVMA